MQLLSRLPKSLLQHSLTQEFLHDRDAIALGRTCQSFFLSLKDVYLMREIRSDYFIQIRVMLVPSPDGERTERRVFILTNNPASLDFSLAQHTFAQSNLVGVNAENGEHIIIIPQLTFTRIISSESHRRIGLPTLIDVHRARDDGVSDDTSYQLHKIADFNFLPESVRKLRIEGGIFDDVASITRLPSMSKLKKLHTIEFSETRLYYLNQPDDGTVWPESLRSLIFGNPDWDTFSEPPVDEVRFPSTLTELTLPSGIQGMMDQWLGLFHSSPYDQVDALQFPPGLTQLIHPCMNHPIAGCQWPKLDSLTELEFGEQFNQSVNGWSPSASLRQLTFGYSSKFNQSISSVQWPAHLEKVSLGFSFDQPIVDCKFPASLTCLHLENQNYNHAYPDMRHTSLKWFFPPGSWNQPMPSLLLPDTVTEIQFGLEFNQSLDGFVFPKQLELLSFCDVFHQPLHRCVLPESLTDLSVDLWYPTDLLLQVSFPHKLARLGWVALNEKLLDHVRTTSLETLLISETECAAGSELVLPKTLRRLSFFQAIEKDNILRSLRLPEGFESITFDSEAPASLEVLHLPSSTRQMTLSVYMQLDSYIPRIGHTQLRVLKLPDSWNQPIDERFTLPETLEELRFGRTFNQPIDALRLPSGLRLLHFGTLFNQRLDAIFRLPEGLQEFKIGVNGLVRVDDTVCAFSELISLLQVQWPSSLTRLRLPDPFSRGCDRRPEYDAYARMISKLKNCVPHCSFMRMAR